MSNRTTLAQLDQMPIREIANLPVEQLAMLLEDVAALKAQAKRYDDWMNGALTIRYGEKAQAARLAEGKDTGTVRVKDSGMAVVCDLPKKVEWAQPKLREALKVIESWNEDPADYLSLELKVSEAKYNAWPPAIRSIFEPARTVSTGRPSYKLERAKSEAA